MLRCAREKFEADPAVEGREVLVLTERLFVYPMLRDGTVTSIDNLSIDADLQPLHDYLARRGSFVDLDNYKPDYLPILSRDVLARIKTGDDARQAQVPPEVGDLIRARGFFGYQPERQD